MIVQQSPTTYCLEDHLGGFSIDLTNKIIDSLPLRSIDVKTEYLLSDNIKEKYPHINFSFNTAIKQNIFGTLETYNVHPELKFQNFICSFNGTAHVSRKMLVSILQRFGFFDTEYCSKNFIFTIDQLDGHLTDYITATSQFYRKFFIADNSDTFFNTIHSFGHVRFNHSQNIYNLENKLTKSFLHIVSETMATSYYPFVTEKFLYSVVTRGLFLAYAQPNWHDHLEKYYGFKQYTKLFNYRFDSIENPVERLVELVCMLSKFSMLSIDDWRDLYLLEQDTVEYNYNHYFSRDYLKCLAKYS